MNTFNKGDRVSRQVYRSMPIWLGTVLNIDTHDSNYYVVEWDKGPYDATTQITKELGGHLIREIDAVLKKNQLEQDFTKLAAAIAPKIVEAAKLLNEAADETRKAGIGQSVRGLDIEDILLQAIENAGWNLSSAHC